MNDETRDKSIEDGRRRRRAGARRIPDETPDTQDASEPDARTPRSAIPEQIQVLPLVALRDTVIFPEMIVPLQVGRERSVKALDRAVRASQPVALITQRSAETEEVDAVDELYPRRHAGQDRPGHPPAGRHHPRHRAGPAPHPAA